MKYTRWVLAVLFLLMALGQVLSFSDFVTALDTYRVDVVPSTLLGGVVILAEVVAGIGLIAPEGSSGRRIGAATSLVVALFWGGMATQAFVRGLVVPNCGCFGRYASQSLSWFVLVQDVSLVSSAVWVYVVERRRSPAAETSRVSVTT